MMTSLKMTLSKEKRILLNILETYKDMPYLWDKRHAGYRNHRLRDYGYHVLLEMYKDIDEKATMNTVKKKISNLRTNYYAEFKKVQSSGHIYEPTLWYYDAFSFLEKCGSESDPLKESFVWPHDDDADDDADDDGDGDRSEAEVLVQHSAAQSDDDASTPAPAKRRRVTIAQQQAEGAVITHERHVTTKDEEWEIMGKSIGLQLRELERKDLVIARKLIADVVYWGSLGRLGEDARVHPGSSPAGGGGSLCARCGGNETPSPSYIKM